MARIVILTEGNSTPVDAKTATGILRYRGDEVVAVLDSQSTGRRVQDVLGVGGDIPFVGSLEGVDADTLLIGIAPAGGALPEQWRNVIRTAIERKMEIISGLHVFLSDDTEFAELARAHGVRIHDVRRPAPGLTVGSDRVRNSLCHRVHTVGQDCGVGKMLVALELDIALRAAGRDSAFLATGQTGIMIAGKGVPADRVVSDFVAGAIEELVLEHEHHEIVCVEGQGSLSHPLYSGVTLGLLHGCAPQTMIIGWDPEREKAKSTGLPVVSLERLIPAYENLAGFLCPSKVVAVAANTASFDAGAARDLMKSTEERLGLPVVDVIRDGCDQLVEIVLARHAALNVK